MNSTTTAETSRADARQKADTKLKIKTLIDNTLEDSSIEPQELAEIIHEGFAAHAGERLYSDKGLYYSILFEVFRRCEITGVSFDGWILTNNLELA